MAPIITICNANKMKKTLNQNATDPVSIQTPSLSPKNNSSLETVLNNPITPCPLRAPLVVIIVGLPCRGKSLAAHKIARHLCWKGEYAKVFQVDTFTTPETLTEVTTWFQNGKNVAIIDGMHLTKQSRQTVISYCVEKVFHYLLIEFNCDENAVEDNIRETAEFYQNFDKQMNWTYVCREKVRKFTPLFETCTQNLDGPLITVHNSENAAVHSVSARGVRGLLQTSILGVLSSPVIRNQLYFFSRHGESEYNVFGRIGGDADLSPRGKCYADCLTKYFTKAAVKPKMIWTSELCRTIHTAQNVPGIHAPVKDLNEINAGICEGLTYEEIQERFPQEFAWRDQDKLKYRYPLGESYLDLLQRVDNVVQALLTQTRVLVVSHQAVLRCIMAYFKGSDPEEIPYINVPLHTILKVKSYGYKFTVETVPLQVECVDTYRDQPKNCSPDRCDDEALDTVPAHFDSLSQPII
ncbi:6-phosphofructo-2-kinase/fructose-2,6-bisphosphatase-like isoform X2 [Contarinia nasturtii]|uniref:6-phosphofructo-2-kinase/fructose-2, 6-bisphosphatase-like isoform X2 n=1 Tax=Contarinia nasturtii TaxID=265458 RepID=UPI0012D49920|nr:6-phosphofructo-2-kinase/fructose-2,6-bisphosphatase-like isoform X2 [Contarinia nasturtii]